LALLAYHFIFSLFKKEAIPRLQSAVSLAPALLFAA
jgi:hypothetical protein